MKKKQAGQMYDLWSSMPEASLKGPVKRKRIIKTKPPHPGQSYNPSAEDHSKLLNKVAKEEIKYQKKARSIRESQAVRLSRAEYNAPETVDLFNINDINGRDNSDDEDDDDIDSDYDIKDLDEMLKDRTVKDNRKTPQQRLKQLKDKLQKREAKIRKIKNIKAAKRGSIKKIVKELDEKDEERALQSRRRRRRKMRVAKDAEISDPVYCLKEDLASNLRSLKCPVKSVVKEQFEAYQKRLLVEPTSIQTTLRRYKKRVYAK